jgi:hypothetical protein
MLSEERKAATKAALREIAKYQASKNAPPMFTQGVTTVVAIDDELASDVFARITAHDPPVILAVYFPKSERIELITLEPEASPGPDDVVRTHRKSTIGMVIDAGSHIAAPQQWHEVFEARKVNPNVIRA